MNITRKRAKQENSNNLTFFSFPVFDSSARMYSLAFGFSQSASKSPLMPFASAQLSRASLLGLTTATRNDSKLFPYTHIWTNVYKI
jgi:hypothetical protein